MIPYILHVTVILTACFLFYKLFLQKETFYRLNRWTLLGCLLLSFALPLLPAPRGWTLIGHPILNVAAQLPSVNPQPVTPVTAHSTAPLNEPSSAPSTAKLPATTKTKSAAYPSHIHSKQSTPRTTITPQLVTKPVTPTTTTPSIQLTQTASTSQPMALFFSKAVRVLSDIYILGLIVFAVKFAWQIALLCYRSYTRPAIREGRFRIVHTDSERGPCTFANTIFVNPTLYDPATFRQILVHEKIHAGGGHTLDILLAELAVVFQWFNPFAWLYRREVENNLEFLTDRSVLQNPDIERLTYQLSLLRVSAPYLPFSITNNYNQSLLKRRIVMMNSQHSARYTAWKYAALLPLLTVLVCILNKPAVYGQTAPAASGQPVIAGVAPAAGRSATSPTVSAAIRGTEIRPVKTPAAAVQPQITAVATPGTLAAPAATPTPSATPSATTTPRVTPTATSIATPAAVADTTIPGYFDMSHGSWFLDVDSNELDFMLRRQEGDNSWQSSFTVDKNEISPFPGQGTVEFKLVREAGTMTFKGTFDGQQGFGRFHFDPDHAYFDAVTKMGVEDMDENRQHSFFLLNIKKEYIAMLQRNGLTPIGQRDLISLSSRRIDEPFLKYWKTSGIVDAATPRNLLSLKSQHIDADYVDDLKKAGYSNLTVQQLIRLKYQHIDGNYVRSISAGSSAAISPEELVSYKATHVDSAWLDSLRKVPGYDHLDLSEIRSLSNARVSVSYIKSWQAAGFSDIAPRTVMTLKMRHMTPELAKSFRTLGYSDLDLNRLASLQNVGITPEFVTSFHKIGFDNIPFNLLYQLKTNGIDADYVAKMKEKGFNSTDLNKYVRLKRDFN
jgi:beta-lactamase regulating signal transducer with metallopeptidase domain